MAEKSLISPKLSLVELAPLIPDAVKDMKKLDKALFEVEIKIPAIKCLPSLCGNLQKEFKHVLFNRPHFKKILPCEESTKNERLILLHTSILSLEMLNDNQKEFIKNNGCTFLIHDTKLTYHDFTFDEIMKKVFSDDTKDIVTSFETVGHIAHLNLKPLMAEKKHLIGILNHYFFVCGCILNVYCTIYHNYNAIFMLLSNIALVFSYWY